MSGSPTRGDALLSALAQRLQAAAAVLLTDAPVPPARPDDVRADDARGVESAPELLRALVGLCRDTGRADARWLLLTAAAGAFPTPDQVVDLGRRLELEPAHAVESALLAEVLAAGAAGRPDLPMTVVSDAVLVDVDFTARDDTHTGIQRVVRETLPRWSAAHGVRPVAWTRGRGAFRELTAAESARILSYDEGLPAVPEQEGRDQPLVVPWRSVVVLAEVPATATSARLTALARFSGNELALIGYDMIPITSADWRPPHDATVFASYLRVVKHAHRVAAISRSAAAEFGGFAHSVTAQGLPGPTVREVVLPGQAPDVANGGAPQGTPPGARPVVLCPGSREPHKNQRTLLHAAERLWREGLDFELRLVGGPGWSDELLRSVQDRLTARGRPLTDLGRVSDARLTQEMRAARFVAFISLHEGYGLPVAEALAVGTPVLTADFGSQAEIAAAGGCLTVDPRDDDAVTAGLRTLLTDDALVTRLRSEALERPTRTWDEYAAQAWDVLVGGRTS